MNEKPGINYLCPDDNALADYIAGNLSDTKAIETHISGCKICLEKLSAAFKIGAQYNEGKIPAAPAAIVKKTKEMLAKQGMLPLTNRRGKNRHLWLIATIIAFIMSFVFPRYFLQCLVATILMGIKWIMESENMRTLILVLDSWRRHERGRDNDISERLRDRSNSILK